MRTCMIGNQNSRRHHISKSQLEDLYIVRKLSIHAIEKLTGCYTIHNLLGKYDIPKRNCGSPRIAASIKPSRTDKSYAAGFFDGEGSINIRLPVRRTGYRLAVSVGQNVLEPLRWLQERWGGPICFSAKRKFWVWHVNCQMAMTFLTDILPYLIRKKEETELAITFQRRKRNRGQTPDIADREQDRKDREHLHSLR